MTLQSTGAALAGDDELRALAPWFHNLHLPDGRQTAPDHPLGDFPAFKWEQIAPHLPEDMRGVRALDIGCNAGFYSLALARRGAEVLGIDVDPHYLRQAEWARRQFGIDEGQLALVSMQVYDLARLSGTFDVVLFLGVLYHLRYPLLALDVVSEKVDGLLILQTLTMPGDQVEPVPEDLRLDERHRMLQPGWPKMAFIERRLEDDPTNWWAPNRACVEAMLRSAGLEPITSPGHEIVVARRSGAQRDTSAELRAIFPR
ncbi:MAG: TIGR04290 family methyltransferase [Solirubrobacterales bacterium]|nr:TIGR04290 family methyltransferase [Solirubrobacterales bacterium]